ncbi:MAG: hypothetical protein APR63_11805 [Desulfuromonas sp. SDB]|nr:MAG: hypothetical protein APR63_11805 [Desulfuromonas sp. SDB]
MIYLIVDGYNLIGQQNSENICDQNLRTKIINQVKSYASYYHFMPVVVFDGKGVTSNFQKLPGVNVIYTNRNTEADQTIIKLVETNKSHHCIVVTKDHDLAKKCRKLGAEVKPNLNLNISNKNKQEIKSSRLSDNDVHYWLDEFGFQNKEVS